MAGAIARPQRSGGGGAEEGTPAAGRLPPGAAPRAAPRPPPGDGGGSNFPLRGRAGSGPAAPRCAAPCRRAGRGAESGESPRTSRPPAPAPPGFAVSLLRDV